MATTILLARHGQSDWNAERRWQGHADRPLTAEGRRQAEVLAERLRNVELDAICSSDLRRALETAEVLAERHGLEVEARRDLREVDVGSWSGLTRAQVAARFPDGHRRWEQGLPGWTDGETYEQMAERVVAAVRDLAGRHPQERLLVVTHAGPIRAVHAAAIGIDIHRYRRARPVEPNARLSAVCLEAGAFTELCPASDIDTLLERDRAERAAAAAGPPTPAG